METGKSGISGAEAGRGEGPHTLEEGIAAHRLRFVVCSETVSGADVTLPDVVPNHHTASRCEGELAGGGSSEGSGGHLKCCRPLFRPDVEYALLLNPIDEILWASETALMLSDDMHRAHPLHSGLVDQLDPLDLTDPVHQADLRLSRSLRTLSGSVALALTSISGLDPAVLHEFLGLDPHVRTAVLPEVQIHIQGIGVDM